MAIPSCYSAATHQRIGSLKIDFYYSRKSGLLIVYFSELGNDMSTNLLSGKNHQR